jgi:hypothetical protein
MVIPPVARCASPHFVSRGMIQRQFRHDVEYGLPPFQVVIRYIILNWKKEDRNIVTQCPDLCQTCTVWSLFECNPGEFPDQTSRRADNQIMQLRFQLVKRPGEGGTILMGEEYEANGVGRGSEFYPAPFALVTARRCQADERCPWSVRIAIKSRHSERNRAAGGLGWAPRCGRV